MKPYYDDGHATVHHGDCLDVLAELPDASIDAVVTDPPYGLSNTDPTHVVETLTQWANGNRDYVPEGRGFMGKAWDAFVPPVAVWDECLRVLKPGGHLLAFAGSRTFDLMTLGVRMAGFEIRDGIAWLYAQGFPKSLDVSKAIDKARDDTEDIRVVCRWLRARLDENPKYSVGIIGGLFGFHPRMVEHWMARDTDSQPSLPTIEQWDRLREMLGFGDEMDAEVYRLNLRKGEPAEAWADREIVGTVDQWNNRTNYALTSRDGLRRGESKNVAAKAWQGWGTALKPAFEPVVVARKPLTGTVAANVLAHGTGALNIDGCRVCAPPDGDPSRFVGIKGSDIYAQDAWTKANMGGRVMDQSKGRWPTNVILDDTTAQDLDEQTGILTSGANPTRRSTDKFRDAYGDFKGQEECTPARGADSGGASRMFPVFRYEPKAPTTERPRHGAVAHPTVKPLDLMRWLVRLVTPPGGTVLEPFAGSGTTAEACVAEGFQCIAIEREADYLPLIMQRLSKPIQVALDFDGEAS